MPTSTGSKAECSAAMAMDTGSDDEEADDAGHTSKAEAILSQCDPPPVVAIDLDYTIWPVNCYEHTLPPYSSHPGGGLAERIYCVDARSKSGRSVDLYPEVREVLQWCIAHRITLTICSKSPSRSIAEGMLRAYGMWDWFVFPQVFNSRSKTYHFRNLSEATGLQMRDFLFYDDDHSNVTVCGKLGVACQLVDREQGLSWRSFAQGLEVFRAKQSHSKSMGLWSSPSSSAYIQQQEEAVTSAESSMRSDSSLDLADLPLMPDPDEQAPRLQQVRTISKISIPFINTR